MQQTSPKLARSRIFLAVSFALTGLAAAPASSTPSCPLTIGANTTIATNCSIDGNDPIEWQVGQLDLQAVISGSASPQLHVAQFVTVGGVHGINNNSSGVLGSLTNDGTIDTLSASIFNFGSITSLINNGAISSVASSPIFNFGVITTLSNTGTISANAVAAGVPGIINFGSIGTLTNTGSISSTNFAGIYNAGTITRLVNGQSSTLSYQNILPVQYVTYFSTPASYGKVAFSALSGYSVGSYGIAIANGQNYAVGTYSAVMTSDARLTIGSQESVSGVSYHLVDAGDGLSWNLVIDHVSSTRVEDSITLVDTTPTPTPTPTLPTAPTYPIAINPPAASTTRAVKGPAVGAARVIDANPNLLALFAPLTSDAQLSSAASQTLPLLTGGSTSAVRSTMSGVSGIVQSRISHVNGRASGDGFLGNNNVWLKPFASRSDQNSRDGLAGYKTETYGLVGGVDGTLSPATHIGGAFAYAGSNINGKSTDAPQRNDISIYQLVGYGSYRLDERSEVNFQVDVGQNNNKGQRQIAFASSVASSSYGSKTAHVGTGIGRTYAITGATTLAPSLRADYTRIKDEAYQETGAGLLNLHVGSRSTEALVIGIDGKLAHQLNNQIMLIANLGVGYDTVNKPDAISAAFAGAPGAAFVTYGINPTPWISRVGVGAVYKSKNGLEITGSYDVEHREGFLNQSAAANLRWVF